MRSLIQPKNATPLFVIGLLLACFGLTPLAWAVAPAPDGGYPGGNTAEGQNALLDLTTGTYNTAVGWSSLGFLTTGSLNTGIGVAALLFNTADQNTATGAGALLSNTTGLNNTANGAFALVNSTEGSYNVAAAANHRGLTNFFSNAGTGGSNMATCKPV